MAGQLSTYQVLNRQAPKQAADGIVRGIADQLKSVMMAQSPHGRTGQYAAGWRLERIKPGIYRVFNEVRYGKYVEYGTRFVPARPVFGRNITLIRSRVSR
jgi:hypothetical protein